MSETSRHRKAPAARGANRAAKAGTGSGTFTAEERQAMKDLARERRAARNATPEQGEAAVLARIAAMPDADRVLAQRLHAIVRENAPDLVPRLWYGMPAYTRNGKVVCHFQDAQKFKTRYATFAFMHEANLDDGPLWPTAFAVTELTPAGEAKIAALLRKAVS